MRTRNGWAILGAAIAITLSAGTCRADLLQNCATCQGSTYLLTYDPTKTTTTGTTSFYDVFLTIDPTHYVSSQTQNLPAQIYIQAVAIKIADQTSVGSTLVSAPGNTAAWTLLDGGLNANNCDGSGSGFLCAQDATSAPVPFAGTYTWEFHYATATSNSLLLGPLASSIKVVYTDGTTTTDNKGNITYNKIGALVSEDITLQRVPDGGMTLMLLGGALVGLETLRRRFRA